MSRGPTCIWVTLCHWPESWPTKPVSQLPWGDTRIELVSQSETVDGDQTITSKVPVLWTKSILQRNIHVPYTWPLCHNSLIRSFKLKQGIHLDNSRTPQSFTLSRYTRLTAWGRRWQQGNIWLAGTLNYIYKVWASYRLLCFNTALPIPLKEHINNGQKIFSTVNWRYHRTNYRVHPCTGSIGITHVLPGQKDRATRHFPIKIHYGAKSKFCWTVHVDCCDSFFPGK